MVSLLKALNIFLTVALATSNTANLNLVDHIFQTVSKNVEIAVVDIFKALQLPANFIMSQNTKKETDMYRYLKNTVNVNHKAFLDITTFNCIEEKNNVTLLDEIINEVLNGSVNCTNAEITIESEFNNYIPKISRNNPEDPYELSLEFIRDFMNKINDWSLDDIVIQKPDTTSIKNSGEINIEDNNTISELPVWDPDDEISDDEYETRRLFKGKKTSIARYPFMSSIHVDGEFMCAGCIIRSELVITAASCLQRVYEEKNGTHNITVKVGTDYVAMGGIEVVATHAVFHPFYSTNTLHNNLALLSVAKNAFTKLKWIKRIKYQEVDFRYDSVKILGWGIQSSDKPISTAPTYESRLRAIRQRTQNLNKSIVELSYDSLELYSLEECRNIYTRDFITNKNFCAGYLLSGNGACRYDIGGPGINNGILLGIVSFGPETCGAMDKPTVFTKMFPYLHWIHKVLHEVIPKTKSKLENVTFIKTRKQSSLYLKKRRPVYINYRKVMNVVRPPAKVRGKRKQNYIDSISSNIFKNDSNSLLPLLCLFDENCELELDYSEEGKQNRAIANEEELILLGDLQDNADKNLERSRKTKQMKTIEASNGPQFRNANQELSLTSASEKSHPDQAISEIDDSLESEIPSNAGKHSKPVKLGSSEVSDIAAAVFWKNKLNKKGRAKDGAPRKRRRRRRRHRNRRRRRRKKQRGEILYVGTTYVPTVNQ